MWRRIFRRIGIPALVLLIFLVGFILGRSSGNGGDSECEPYPPIVQETDNNGQENNQNGEPNDTDDPSEPDNQEENSNDAGDEPSEPEHEWEQP